MKINIDPIHPCKYIQNYNHGFNLALLDKDNRVYFSPFQCKDYLQDIFWCHRTGRDAEIYGIVCKKGMIDDSLDTFKLGILGGKFNMRNRIPSLTKFINTFEDAQGFKHTKIDETEEDSNIVINFSREWTENGLLLSTFATAVRLAGAYEDGDIITYLKKLSDDYKSKKEISPVYVIVDASRLPVTINKFAAVLKGIKIDYPWDKITSVIYAHNMGIVEYNGFPTVEVK